MNSEGLDALDKKILDVIKENARLSYSDIGAQVGISRVAVKNRMDILEKKVLVPEAKQETLFQAIVFQRQPIFTIRLL